MVFSSLTFLFGYLPLTLALYFLTPLRRRNFVLLLASLFFYGWGEPVYVGVMFLSIFIDYTHGLLVERFRQRDRLARWFVGQSVVFNLLLLGFFKYWDFLAANLSLLPGITVPQLGLPLPLGISFFTFQTMSYTIDVYRRDAPVQRNIIGFGAYVTLFPQLIAGPIVKYKTVAAELVHRTVTSRDFAEGACRFTAGLAKKVLLANAAGALWESCQASQNAGALTVAGGWTGLFAFGLQIYFDFSGYSDMAIGLGRILGFRFDENFDHPYLSTSVGEFWRRWHMSLTSWFREYLYFPLGGSRAGSAKTLRNLLIVWFCTGFWHGASWNFVLWGLYFGLWLILERFVFRDLLARTPVLVKRFYTLLVVFVGWGIFAMEDLGVCGRYLAVCFGGGPLWSAPDGYRLRSWALILLLLALGSTTLAADLWKKIPERGRKVLAPVLMALGLVVSTAYLVDGSYNPFLYFRF
ncbi:MBOAT family protein [Oscillibacter sp.]|uniref:MBOAT family O-acyltransferase n=1 Tax=Oscillibacter sp. TaxID=1945593 RepID=UPI00216DE636|nr:MBOAT family O-acyltransferase [Oscillibacter sp.]MCI8842106.1 MBOAT family protein [Oscillibacter sp.]MCI9114251.1 MBOAT family protein [Oscillibacter sp.]